MRVLKGAMVMGVAGVALCGCSYTTVIVHRDRVTTTTTSTLPAPVSVPLPTTPTMVPPSAPVTTPTTLAPAPASPATASNSGFGCVAADAYLAAHADPVFTWICSDRPGTTIMGHAAATCIPPNAACTAGPEIAIADPCPAAYMNEASNSWVLEGLSDAPIDPYGSCPA